MSTYEYRKVELGLGGVPLMTAVEAVISWIAHILAMVAAVLTIFATASQSPVIAWFALAALAGGFILLSGSRLFR